MEFWVRVYPDADDNDGKIESIRASAIIGVEHPDGTEWIGKGGARMESEPGAENPFALIFTTVDGVKHRWAGSTTSEYGSLFRALQLQNVL